MKNSRIFLLGWGVGWGLGVFINFVAIFVLHNQNIFSKTDNLRAAIYYNENPGVNSSRFSDLLNKFQKYIYLRAKTICISDKYREHKEHKFLKSWDFLEITFCLWVSQQYNDSRTRGKIASTKSSCIPLAKYILQIFSFTFSLSHHGLDFWECWSVNSACTSREMIYQHMIIQCL